VSDVVRLETEGPLAVLTFDSPPLNLFDDAVFDGFREAIDKVAADPPRGLLIRAEGKVVSGGVDVGRVFDGMSAQRGGELWDELLATIAVLEELPLPTVFAAHGLCLTAAFEIAKELIFTGELFDAATLKEWGVVNRVSAPDAFEADSRAFAEKVANGPTRAHAATKRLVWESKERGARAADGIVAEVSGPLFDTADLQNAVRSFLTDGPGKATYEGR
jgi:enoyl-CoA hydratase